MRNLKNKTMIAVWIITICVGTLLTILGTYKLSQHLSKEDDLTKQHPIPDLLLLDCEIELKMSDFVIEQIDEELKGRFKKDLDSIPANYLFYDTITQHPFKKVAISNLKRVIVNGILRSDKTNTLAIFSTDDDEILIAPADSKLSRIEILTYFPKEKKFKAKLHNIQLWMEVKTKSQLILDLDNIEISIILGQGIDLLNIKSAVIKSRKTKYFRLDNIQRKDLPLYTAKLTKIV